MSYQYFLKPTILALFILSTLPLLSQTYRINAGVVNGTQNYIEVYEYDFVDQKPEFPGGDCKLMKFINEERRYPATAYRKGIEGRVICSFVVNTDGSVSNISILKGVEPSLNKEAIRVISKMPGWKPGRINGQCVPVRVVRTVPFRK